MYIGIDVGGTCTDAVLLDRGAVRATAKVSTREDLLLTLLEALDEVMKGINGELIERVVFSTTVITNLIAEKKYDPVGLILMPGPGLNPNLYRFPTDTYIIQGAIDYRGREIIPLRLAEVDRVAEELAARGYRKVAVVGKFSCRNHRHEKEVAARLRWNYPNWHIEEGHLVAGQLNFPRRVVSTYLTCATREKYQFFVRSIREAISQRGIKGGVFILKADGGTLPLESSLEVPVETIFSGPAASTLGVQALMPPGESAVVVDIGGTTTDLALILSGQPLLASRGVRVDDMLTHVRALAVKSVPVGGDSVVERVGKDIVIYSERLGAPYCLGGPVPTPTDALRVLGLTRLGDAERAREAMQILGGPLGLSPAEVASQVTGEVIETIVQEIENMFTRWEQEPAYRVWEVLQKKKVRPSTVVGVGGGAAGFISQIAARLGGYPVIPPYAPVANAIGAAVARPTLQVTLRADTEQGFYIIQEEGYQGKITDRSFNEEKALELAKEWLCKRASRYGLEDCMEGLEVTRREVFNMVRDWVTVGRLIDITVQTRRGILYHVGGGGYRYEK
ncbi:hydantoinase/oxoprolinase family protein [Desulfofundulus thermocisternus]|uniref:hydantoinase/oxoprolinase family protein n=1 Tax=Desulfofundulus thermocisternus TaxID=42471 RepID=UPI0019E9F1C2|nr:hydantoinase/oxoprolinase family protein [Desulfofundulus thermocisternus]MBE3585103.1 hydantoinase/oxoprolinase family protein [Thermoanaerobacter sp.]MCS5695946.1 hydantoinase/oxoprolinase family protein [Desulfofundulus thermocisternus]